jgi:hypothetical protein
MLEFHFDYLPPTLNGVLQVWLLLGTLQDLEMQQVWMLYMTCPAGFSGWQCLLLQHGSMVVLEQRLLSTGVLGTCVCLDAEYSGF